jgi:hypothetical protein
MVTAWCMPAIGKRRSRMWSALRLTDAELDALERFTEVRLCGAMLRRSRRYRQMKDDRLRVPMENDYALALGRAIFIFTKLEWSAIECCERIIPDSFHVLKLNERNARILANKLISLAATLPPSLRRTLIPLSQVAQYVV